MHDFLILCAGLVIGLITGASIVTHIAISHRTRPPAGRPPIVLHFPPSPPPPPAAAPPTPLKAGNLKHFLMALSDKAQSLLDDLNALPDLIAQDRQRAVDAAIVATQTAADAAHADEIDQLSAKLADLRASLAPPKAQAAVDNAAPKAQVDAGRDASLDGGAN